MRIVIVMFGFAAFSLASAAQAQTRHGLIPPPPPPPDNGITDGMPALPDASRGVTLFPQGQENRPAWMPAPPSLSLPKRLSMEDARRTLEEHGYYDIRDLKQGVSGYTAEARLYGKRVSVNVDASSGFIAQGESETQSQAEDGQD